MTHVARKSNRSLLINVNNTMYQGKEMDLLCCRGFGLFVDAPGGRIAKSVDELKWINNILCVCLSLSLEQIFPR